MNTEITILIDKYLANEITATEEQQLLLLIEEPGNMVQLEALIDDDLRSNRYVMDPDDKLRRYIYSKIDEKINDTAPVIRGRYRLLKRMAVAASIVGVLFVAGYFLSREDGPSPIAQGDKVHDVKAPDKNRAQITLADGSTIYLDSANNGELFTQNGIKVFKTADGKLIYEGSKTPPSEVPAREGTELDGEAAYNTLSNPRGSKVIDITLADGSHVWLNAGSSITYPVAFINKERKVSITGEAYFEITHNASKPFRVSTNPPSGGRGADIEVLGTHFNVNAYDDESEIKVTLLEGSVRVSQLAAKSSQLLRPGQQAIIAGEAMQPRLTNSVDIEKIMAWKNNVFLFSGDDIQSVMRQLARWYDVEVEFKGQITDLHFTGIISRNNKISEVLRMLQGTEKIKFEINERKITVSK